MKKLRMPRSAGTKSRGTPSRLIHIGPHKTGTTTIQSAFGENREALARHGVHYVGRRLRTTLGVTAVTGMAEPRAVRDARMIEWEGLVAESRGARQVVLSNEFLCEADQAAAERVVADLGPDDTRIVVTLRPLAKILPSQWQQFVQSGTTTRFTSWLDAVLANDDDPTVDDPTVDDPTVELFWRRHRHDELVERWANVVSAENVSVIVCDSQDTDQLPRVFADLLGLPAGLLAPGAMAMNRSFTWEEAEVVRRFNEQLEVLNVRRGTRGEEPLELTTGQRVEAWRHVKRRKPRKTERPIALPPSACPAVERLSVEMVDKIMSLGVDVIGDPKTLTEVPAKVPAKDSTTKGEPTSVPAGLAARVTTGLLAQVMTPAEDS